jgi:molybdenum cofactor cytidylyltransferase
LTHPRIGAVVLAAGTSSRMGSRHKLLEPIAGRPVIDHVMSCALGSTVECVVVVVGHRAEEVRALLPDGVTIVENPKHAEGLSTSLVAGIRALPDGVDGAVVLLGDMPHVTSSDVLALVGAFRPGSVCVPTVEGRRGNPVLWSSAFFDRILKLDGDRGARSILESNREGVIEVPLENPGLFLDVDTPEDLDRARRFR